MNLDDAPDNKPFEGWAIIEQMGHNRYAGYVTTEAYGQAVLFRIDVPALEERERTTERPSYDSRSTYVPAGAKIREGAVPGYTKYIGPATLYALTPCSREAILKVVEDIQPRPVMVLNLPQPEQLPEPSSRFHGDGDLMDDLDGDETDELNQEPAHGL